MLRFLRRRRPVPRCGLRSPQAQRLSATVRPCPQHIRAVRFHLPNQGCQVLEIDVAACPTFTTERVSSEMTPSVQVSRALEPSLDFTGGFAASERTHRAVFPAGCLAPHLHRLLAGAPHQGAQGPPAPPALHPGLPFGIPGLATLAATMQSQSSAENTLMTMARLLQQLGIQQHLQAHDMEGPEDVISPMTSAEQEHVSGVSVDESRESLDREPPLQRGGAGLGVSGGVRECMPGDDLHARGGLCPHVTQVLDEAVGGHSAAVSLASFDECARTDPAGVCAEAVTTCPARHRQPQSPMPAEAAAGEAARSGQWVERGRHQRAERAH